MEKIDKLEFRLSNDLLFKKLFASPETADITRLFLRDICGINAQKITIKPTDVYDVSHFENVKKENDIIVTKVDLLVMLDDDKVVTIELQNQNHPHFVKRAILYHDKAYISEYNEAEGTESNKYASLKPTYSVNILNFIHFKKVGRINPVTKIHYCDEEYGDALTDDLTGEELKRIIFVELPKINDDSPLILRYWKLLFETGKVPADAPSHLKKAAQFISFENTKTKERKAMLDMRKLRADSDAVKDGWRQEGLLQGRLEGRQEGRLEGRQEGRLEEREKMQIQLKTLAQNLRRQGFSDEKIAETMALSIAQIEELLQK